MTMIFCLTHSDYIAAQALEAGAYIFPQSTAFPQGAAVSLFLPVIPEAGHCSSVLALLLSLSVLWHWPWYHMPGSGVSQSWIAVSGTTCQGNAGQGWIQDSLLACFVSLAGPGILTDLFL